MTAAPRGDAYELVSLRPSTPTATAQYAASADPTVLRQLRALSLQSLSLLSRAKLLHLCCVVACPVLAVSIAGIVALTIGSLARDAPSSETLFCSGSPSMMDSGALWDFDTFERPPNVTTRNHAGFYTLYWATSFAKRFSCAYALDSSYPVLQPYFPDAKMPSGAQLDTTYLPQIAGGWAAFKTPEQASSLSNMKKPLYQHLPQFYPWAYYIDGEAGFSVGTKPRQTAPTSTPAPDTNSTTPAPPPSDISVKQSGLLGNIATRFAVGDGNSSLPYPYFERADSDAALANALQASLDAVARTPVVNSSFPFPPHGYMIFNSGNLAKNQLSVTLQYGTPLRIANDQRLSKVYPTQGWRQLIAYSQIMSGFLATKFPGKLQISRTLQALPRVINPVQAVDATGAIGFYFYPFALSFLLPLFVMKLVKEREGNLYMMMKMHGLRRSVYFLTNYAFFFSMQLISAILFVCTGLAFKLTLFTRTDPGLYIILLLLWCNITASLSFFLSLFFDKARRAIVSVFVLVIFSLMLHLISDTFFVNGSVSLLWLVHPSFAFYYGLRLMAAHASFLNGMDPLYLSTLPPEMKFGLCALAIEGVVFLILSWFIWDTRRDLHGRISFGKIIKSFSGRHSTADVELPIESQIDMNEYFRDKPTVVGSLTAPYSVVVRNLTKRYSRGNVAVRNVSISLETGTVFGLLGPNGAGKTTLLRMLTGLVRPTSGEAYISGHSIFKNLAEIHKLVGVCPQEDLLFPDLTTFEHVLFYCRLRGVRRSDEYAAAKKALRAVQLEYAENTYAQHLSGGERRRLGIGIALAGTTRVIFLDEPTTGVDPEAKRGIWNIIQNVSKNVTIILTTHSMDEAEMLCSKIGILADGQFKCVGTLEDLRARFAAGFRLSVLFYDGESDKARRAIQNLLPYGTRIIDDSTNFTVYQLQATEKISRIFAEIGDIDGVRDYSVGQICLEDIFIETTSTPA